MLKRSLLTSSIILALEAAAPNGVVRLLSDDIRNPSAVDAGKTITVTITRAGNFTDPRYGEFTLSLDMFNRIIDNFNNQAYGQEIALDVAHNPSNGAAGYFKSMGSE